MADTSSIGYDGVMDARIVSTPGTCGGKPRIRDTRMTVQAILELLAHGAPVAEIVEDYPWISADDVAACLLYAARQVDRPVVDLAAE